MLSSCLVFYCPSINNRMNRQVLQPFRAPRNRGDTTQARVHRKDNSAHFKEMERWMDKNLTGEGVGSKVSEAKKGRPAKTSATRRSAISKDKQDTEVHSIPCKKGIKMMSERECDEMLEHGEVLRWNTDSGEDEYPQIDGQSTEKVPSDSEEPTEFGVVWERFLIKETEDMDGGPPTTQLSITTKTKDTIAISGSNIASPTTAVPIVSDGVSPCLF